MQKVESFRATYKSIKGQMQVEVFSVSETSAFVQSILGNDAKMVDMDWNSDVAISTDHYMPNVASNAYA